VPAVIDKDLAAAKLADLVKADYLFIMTEAP
jgi:carbamate kinase